jgi:hypothetical protein
MSSLFDFNKRQVEALLKTSGEIAHGGLLYLIFLMVVIWGLLITVSIFWNILNQHN